MESIFYLIGVGAIVTVISILFGSWVIINRAFEKRDKKIEQLLLSEQKFKDHKESTCTILMGFSEKITETNKRISKTEDRIDKIFDRITDKLDKINDAVNEQAIILARLEERTRNKDN